MIASGAQDLGEWHPQRLVLAQVLNFLGVPGGGSAETSCPKELVSGRLKADSAYLGWWRFSLSIEHYWRTRDQPCQLRFWDSASRVLEIDPPSWEHPMRGCQCRRRSCLCSHFQVQSIYLYMSITFSPSLPPLPSQSTPFAPFWKPSSAYLFPPAPPFF